MATKKFIELQDFSKEDLLNELRETENIYNKLLFDHSVKGLDNPMKIKDVRRDISRIKTEVRKREIAAMTEQEIKGRSKIRSRRRNS